jgi:hypothetical protein
MDAGLKIAGHDEVKTNILFLGVVPGKRPPSKDA